MVFRQQEQTSSQQDKYIKTWLCGVEDEDKEHGSPDAAPKPSMLDRSHPCPRRPRSEPEQDLNMQKGRQRADATVSKRYVVEEVHEFSKGRSLIRRSSKDTLSDTILCGSRKTYLDAKCRSDSGHSQPSSSFPDGP